MSEVDFSHYNTSTAWFETQDPKVRSLISSRLALRSIAFVGQLDAPAFSSFSLASLRAVLISSLHGYGHISDFDVPKPHSPEMPTNAAGWANLSAELSVRAASLAEDGSNTISTSVAALTGEISAAQTHLIVLIAQSDAEQIQSYQSAKPLWINGKPPRDVFDAHHACVRRLRQDVRWAFWQDWYLGMWDGTWSDWDLAHEVALIEDDVWSGEDALAKIAARITEIETRRKLEQEIASLKAKLKQTKAKETSVNRHHNNPPPDALIEIEESVNREVILIWEQIDKAEVEISKAAPDPLRLNAIAQALWDISVRIAAYCGSLADTALQESAKVVGKTGTQASIGLIVTTTAAQNEGVKSVAKALWDFAKALGAG